MHDAFAKHNSALGPTGSGGIKTMLNEKSMVPGKPQTPAQHQSVVKAAKASAANRSTQQLGTPVAEGIAKPKAKPGFSPNPFGEKKDF
jgi:hypothetical protein